MEKISCRGLVFGLLLLVCLPAKAQDYHLQKADSLFAARKYTESYDLYLALFNQGRYSPAMLLRMAYIREGLNAFDDALYYLNLYYNITSDREALRKMNELATRFNLTGYDDIAVDQAVNTYLRHHEQISLVLAAGSLLLFSAAFYLHRRRKSPVLPMIPMGVLLVLLMVHLNIRDRFNTVIIDAPQTYLMSKPSAGGDVIEVIGEGHKLRVTGQEDVWYRVDWNDQELYVRSNQVKEVRLRGQVAS